MWHKKISHILNNTIFPLAIFCMLTGLFWVGDRSVFHKIFYYLCVLPSLLLILTRPGIVTDLLTSRIFVAYLLFAAYLVISLSWSTNQESAISLIKRPFLVPFLFFIAFELAHSRNDLFQKTITTASAIAIVAAIFALALHWQTGETDRLVGYGAFDNPLLTSHVFGFFIAWWLGMLVAGQQKLQPYAFTAVLVLGSVLLATGARTPLFATAATVLWLAIISGNRRAMLAVLSLVVIGVTIWLLAPNVLTQRGLSYRTEIWLNVWQQIIEKPWLGHGYGAPLEVRLDGFSFVFLDSHNMTLSVIFCGGIIGLILWIVLYGITLFESWQWRKNIWVQAFSSTVIYGLVAGMTEGGSFISRPKEHWFLIWIPITLLAATTWRLKKHGEI